MDVEGAPAMSHPRYRRSYPVGAEVDPDGGVDFRVWAPKRSGVEVVFEGELRPVPLEPDGGGYFRAPVRGARAGIGYRLRLEGGDRLFPDPASRYQPEGPHGPSVVIDPRAFPWTDAAWAGVSPVGQVVYELHIGTFTPEGTWAAAERQLEELVRLGVTALEVMPIAEFPGRFGWGYDGVNLFAPTRLYGSPEDARRFVNAAHALGLGVILDVVYNHFGPDGNYLSEFSDTYVTSDRTTDWGAALNFDREGSDGTRSLVIANAGYWIDEFHFDGLRLDATQNIYDDSNEHILSLVGRAVREASRGRATFMVAENESQDSRLIRPVEAGGYGLDTLWNDDFHHTARVALTGRREAYYTDYGGTPQELVSALKWGFLYQGQYYAWQKQSRGKPSLDLLPSKLMTFLENHDQVANSARGERLHLLSSPGRYRALVALMLLGPATPLLFQGEEFASSRPFLFFADHPGELGRLVRDGRRTFLEQFPSVTGDVAERLAAPGNVGTFEACKLDFSERLSHHHMYDFYRDLLELRRSDGVLGAGCRRLDGAVLSQRSFVLRFFGDAPGDDRLVLVNLGPDEALARVPEPLLAPPSGASWDVLWSSEEPRYGGSGAPPLFRESVLHLLGESAVALTPKRSA
jgi:maltooligosyltrehalose trehalohydrolase